MNLAMELRVQLQDKKRMSRKNNIKREDDTFSLFRDRVLKGFIFLGLYIFGAAILVYLDLIAESQGIETPLDPILAYGIILGVTANAIYVLKSLQIIQDLYKKSHRYIKKKVASYGDT